MSSLVKCKRKSHAGLVPSETRADNGESQAGTVEGLLASVEKIKKEYKADSYSMSIGELVNLHHNGELNISPDFQRYYRWNDSQKSRLIESVLLGIPIPSIFVYQDERGRWELVDGLQRVSTFLELMGMLPARDPLRLSGTKLLPGLEGYRWDGGDKVLPDKIQLIIKRKRVDIQIIENDTDPDAKYEIFQRLNTGGSILSPQEVRNVVAIMRNKPVYEWLVSLAEDESFQRTAMVSDRLREEKYDVELALRHISFLYIAYGRSDVDEFLDDAVNSLCDTKSHLDRGEIGLKFRKTFRLIDKSLGDSAFKKHENGKYSGKFLESSFEAISFGLHHNIDSYNPESEDDLELVRKKVLALWSNPTFLENRGTGSYARKRIPVLLALGKEHFQRP